VHPPGAFAEGFADAVRLLWWATVSEPDWISAWDGVVARGDASAVEEFWLARLEAGVGDGAAFTEALRRLRGAGKKTLAATLLELADEQARTEGAWEGRKRFVSEMLRLGIGNPEEHRAALEECVRHLWPGRPSLKSLLAHYSLRTSRKSAETLETLELWLEHDVGSVFSMAGRGPGRVVEASPKLGILRLDFEKERHVPVPIDAARKYLTPLPAGHFLRRRLEEREALGAEVARDPQGTLEQILESLGGPLSVPEIKAALAGLLPEDMWTGWWNRAKKNPRLLAAGQGSRVQYRLAGEHGAEQEIRAEFANISLERQVEMARRHGARSRELGAWMGAELLRRAGEPGADPGVAWEALSLAARSGADAAQVHSAREAVLAAVGPALLLEAVGDATQREAVLDFIREHHADGSVEVVAAWLEKETNARLLLRATSFLIQAGESARVHSFLDQVLVSPTKLPAAFVWLCEEDDEALAPLLEERRGGALLVRLVELAERREFGPFRPRLKEIVSPSGLAARIVQERLTVDQARRIVQIVENPGELADERNWLRRAVTARFPELRPGAAADFVPALNVTVLRLQDELRALLEKEIPETLRAIQEARAHGDLSENFEYHAARARQEFLSARASDLQADLARVRIVDPATVDTARIRVGTRVWLEPEQGGERRAVTILGPYEADPAQGIVSNASEAAQGLLEKAAGDPVKFDGATWTVGKIEPAI
jgi:transcription elongation GreA/GreB family factor